MTQKYVEIVLLEGVESFALFEFVGLDQAADEHEVEARLISPYRRFPCSFLCLHQPKIIKCIIINYFKDGVVVIFGVLGVFLGSFFSLGHEFDCCLGLGSS